MVMPGLSLIRRVAEAVVPDVAVERGHGSAAIEADSRRLDALLAGEASAAGWRLWTNSRCLVTTRRFAAKPSFVAAAHASAAHGWPVFVRPSGGTTVAHGPDTLNVSHFESWRGGSRDVTRRFEMFCEHLARSFRSVGIEAGLGPVDHSHCDGRFNIVAGGRKLAGTASLVRQARDLVGLLSHASIWVGGDVVADIKAIESFEADLGLDTAYSVKAHTTLEFLIMSASEGPLT